MSVDMYVSSSQSQAFSVAAICRQQKQDYEQLQRSINDFVVGSPQLDGVAYDSAKQFFQSVLIPLSKGGILLSEAVMEACQKFPEEYIASVDSGNLKESELIEKIERLKRLMSELSNLQQRLQSLLFSQQEAGSFDGSIAFRMSGNHSLMATYKRTLQNLEEKLAKLLAFNASSPAIFAEISALEVAVSQGSAQVGFSWNSSLGSFMMPKADKMKWAATIADSWVIRDNKIKGIDPAKVEELKDYDIYAKVIYDVDGNPKVFWQLMKDGKGIKNKELYQYLKKAGEYLDPNMFEFISLEEWDKMVKEGFKNGINIENGDEYKGAIKGIVATSQVVENVYTWTTESELAQALQILGFTYSSYRIASSVGKSKVMTNEITSKYDDVHTFEYNGFDNPGPLDDFRGQPNKNFYGGRYDTEVLTEPKVLYRAGDSTSPLGQWFTEKPPSSIIEVRINSAVKPQWLDKNGVLTGSSSLDRVYSIEIPAGTTLYKGPVGPQGGIYQGGLDNNQIFIKEPWNIEKGVNVLDVKPLK